MTKPTSPTPCEGPFETPPIDWRAALSRHDRWLRTVVFARLGDGDAVDDVMQEVSLAAIRQSGGPVDPAKVGPWLYRVAVRQALLWRRKRGRRRKLADRFARQCCPDERNTGEPDPLDWLLADERRGLVRAALKSLPPRDAEILLLKYTEDWSYRQLAQHLGVTQSAIESRLHRARKRLRAALAAREVLEVKS